MTLAAERIHLTFRLMAEYTRGGLAVPVAIRLIAEYFG